MQYFISAAILAQVLFGFSLLTRRHSGVGCGLWDSALEAVRSGCRNLILDLQFPCDLSQHAQPLCRVFRR